MDWVWKMFLEETSQFLIKNASIIHGSSILNAEHKKILIQIKNIIQLKDEFR